MKIVQVTKWDDDRLTVELKNFMGMVFYHAGPFAYLMAVLDKAKPELWQATRQELIK